MTTEKLQKINETQRRIAELALLKIEFEKM